MAKATTTPPAAEAAVEQVFRIEAGILTPLERQLDVAASQQGRESNMSGDARGGEVRPSRMPLTCSPSRLAADTPAKRLADRVLPRGVGMWIYFTAVSAGVLVAPVLPLRLGLGLALAATVAGGWWCLVNFWRCREAHCMVSGIGWAALAGLEVVELALGRNYLFGSEGLFFIAILVVAFAFEGLWRALYGTNAVTSHRGR